MDWSAFAAGVWALNFEVPSWSVGFEFCSVGSELWSGVPSPSAFAAAGGGVHGRHRYCRFHILFIVYEFSLLGLDGTRD